MVALLFTVFFTLLSGTANADSPQSAVVVVPVADVWSRPLLAGEKHSDNLRETQVLFGETVEVVASSGDWVYVNAIEQPSFIYHQRWEGYPGWVDKAALRITIGNPQANFVVVEKWFQHAGTTFPLGSKFENFEKVYKDPPSAGEKFITPWGLERLTPKNNVRSRILEKASLLIGDPYIWGGLSPFDETHKIRLTGVDCSGLVHLAYRVNGLTVPRDSMEQYMKAEKIKRAGLKPADLIFSAKADNPKKITHVALYAGNGQIIEAPQTGMVVRKISFKDKYGKELEEVESGDRVGDRILYFGSFLQTGSPAPTARLGERRGMPLHPKGGRGASNRGG